MTRVMVTGATGFCGRPLVARLAAAGVPCTILRPVLIYGGGLKGNLATFARLAALPIPLPFGSLANRRSLLGIDNFIDALMFVLRTPATRGETYLVADPQPISLVGIVAALRRGRGRRPGLFTLPPRLVEALARLAGGAKLWDRHGGEFVVDPAKLMAAGWTPSRDTEAALTIAARALPPST